MFNQALWLKIRRPGKAAILGVVVVSWVTGLAMLLVKPVPAATMLPEVSLHPPERHNLAAARFGPSVRASSYFKDVYSQHHPAFLIDERRLPTNVEKWASRGDDRTPWIEIRWRGAHQLTSVVIAHAGTVEAETLTIHSYAVICLRQGAEPITLNVPDNRDSVATHPLSCSDAIGLRVEFVPNWWGDLARIYEIEAWGQ